ncbi:hypothetical protein TRVL_04051 [Trypanosoma vivax]|nr:hypothetical protein TRVL_04051 [Trypanosoma vivax]
MRMMAPIWCQGLSTRVGLSTSLPWLSRAHYFQRHAATRVAVDGAALSLKHPTKRGSTHLQFLEPDRGEVSVPCVTSEVIDDDVVLDPSHEESLQLISAASERDKLGVHHPAARGISTDVIDLVTDAYKESRNELIAKRRRFLYELTHPNPSDYTYNDKLVPPPPLSFGKITREAITLGNKVMVEQRYSLVRQAGVYRENAEEGASGVAQNSGHLRHGRRKAGFYDNQNYFFEINDLYQEIVLVGKACAGKSSLLNALLGQQVAKTSSTPHTTRKISFYQSVSPEEMQRFLNVKGNGLVKLPGGGLQLTFVDVPGFGIEGMSDQWRDKTIALTDAYLGVRRSVNTVLFCIDCERGLTKVDLRYFTWLENLHGVFFVVLTKCDSVPHSRVCSVMRQIYSTITKYRRKYRKVFPYIIPTSAKEGTNIEELRGLITETSGLIPGDRLRQILKAKAVAEMQQALKEEEGRLEEARRIEMQTAKAFFAAGGSANGLSTERYGVRPHVVACGTAGCAGTASAVSVDGLQNDSKLALDVDGGPSEVACRSSTRVSGAPITGEGEGGPVLCVQGAIEVAAPGLVAGTERSNRRERFLAWRRVHPLPRHQTPYGVFRLNAGMERPEDPQLELSYTENSNNASVMDRANGAGNEGTRSLSVEETADTMGVDVGPSAVASSVIGYGKAGPSSQENRYGGVSRFLNLIDQYARRSVPPPRNKRERMREERWSERARDGPPTRFLVEEFDGRLAEYKAGEKFGPSVVGCEDVAGRRAQWEAQQYVQQALAVCPTAPWSALDVLRRRSERTKQEAAMRGMSKKELDSYMRNAGRVTWRFEKFEAEVTVAKYMNENRQAKTLRSQQQMHLNSTAKISYGSMPVGLWKRYGEREKYWPTPSVKGRWRE